MRHSFPLRPLSLASPLTRRWLDDIFNLFVQRSLAHWGNKKKKRERCLRRKMSCHRNTFVSGSARCVAVIYGSTYVWNMKGHSSHSSSVCGGRRISMWRSGNTSRRTPLHGTARHFQHIRLSFSDSTVLHQHCPLPSSRVSTEVWLKNGAVRGGKLDFKHPNEGALYARLIPGKSRVTGQSVYDCWNV